MGWQQLAWRLLTPSGLPATGLSLPVVRKVCLDAAAVSMLLVGKAVADPFGDCQQHIRVKAVADPCGMAAIGLAVAVPFGVDSNWPVATCGMQVVP